MDVRLPDGRVVTNVPEGTTKSQLMAKLNKSFPVEESGFLDRVGKAYDNRVGMAQTAADAYQSGEQTLPETALQVTGKGVAGLANDVVGEGFKSGMNAFNSAVPGSIGEEGIANVVNSIKDSSVGDLANSALAKYGEFAKAHPRAARNIESVANIGSYLAAFTPVKGQSAAGVVADAATPLVNATGRTLAAPVKGVKNIAKGVAARDVDELAQATQAIRDRSSQAYNTMRQSGATFTPESSLKIAEEVNNSLKSDGILNHRLHDKTLGLMEDFQGASAKGDLGLEGLDQWRQLFGEVAGNFSDPINARKATLAIRSIDDAVEKLGAKDLVNGSVDAVDALKMGRKEYARARKFEAISDIVKKSDGDANYLKRELKKFADNKKKTRGFSDSELKALKEASSLTTGEGILKMLGKFGFDFGNSRIGSGVGALVGSGVAGAATGGVGATLAPIIGTAARYGQKKIARGKAENLLKMIEK